MPVYDRNTKKFIARYIIPFSISYDHRVIDGAYAAAFSERFSQVLNDIKTLKE